MLKRKRAALLIAYCSLATAASMIVVHDANTRRRPAETASSVNEPQVPAVPLPMTRLADSPFLNPHPPEFETPAIAATSQESEQPRSGDKQSAPFGVYFLRVAIQADSDGGPVTFGPGTQVRLMRHQGGKVRVTRDGTDFLVEESQLTNDLDAVAAIAGTSS